MNHVLTARQFDMEALGGLFFDAQEFERQLQTHQGKQEISARYAGEILINLFYEPSTRTRISFGLAARHLGMGVEGTENAEVFSSAAKGETLEDTIRVLNSYEPAVIVLRHKETGAAERAAQVSQVPIINAGDGTGEHPTQALLDLYTIAKRKKRVNNLHVVIGGDLSRGRTAKSLVQLLAKFPGNHASFVSLPEYQMSDEVKRELEEQKMSYSESTELQNTLGTADVVYWTRMQNERPNGDHVLKEVGPTEGFVINQEILNAMPRDAIVMHPLPRVGEITKEVDKDPRAAYFEQAGNGKYIRMAIISKLLG